MPNQNVSKEDVKKIMEYMVAKTEQVLKEKQGK
jgi:hypothetical protein